jgi:peptidoglycan/LPS O-acetylase OafA/YrhL
MLARFSALKRSDRLRAIGWLVLASGLAGAAAFWLEARTVDPALDDVTALGYTRSLRHGMGVMMGQFGSILTDWQESLTSPIGQALTIAVCAALVAAYFFRVAWVLDAEEEES